MNKNTHDFDELIFRMKEESKQKDKLIWTSMWLIMILDICALVLSCFCVTYFFSEGPLQNLLLIVIILVFLLPCFYALKLEASVGAYKCKNCGSEFKPTYMQVLNAMHIGTTRYLKCPECQKRTWSKKIIK